ncbi:MAG: EndoU domain-containing protein [Hyphomicrobiaceae bacterium]|nr:EndoU domain-containing protein [Hyphomicrobiaceae bacterium]
MIHCRQVPIAIAATSLLLALTTAAAPAQDFFEAARDFIVDKPCESYRTVRTKADPQPLEVGKTYIGRGTNRRDNPTHAFIRIGKDNRWVELTCGHFAASSQAGEPRPQDGPRADSRTCLPFFDSDAKLDRVKVGGLVDVAPPAPVLQPFDTQITDVCGSPGKEVTRDEITSLLRSSPEVLARLKAFTRSKVFADRPARADTDAYISDLAEAWSANHGFTHIFCGEPGAGTGRIGGLHFHARYLQLQKNGEACRMSNFRQNEVVPGVIYTMGVLMKNASGRFVQDARKGYGLTLSGEDLLKAVTRAFSENPGASASTSNACLVSIKDDGHQLTAVFARRTTGIRTFYPDATPNGEPCAAPINLQD